MEKATFPQASQVLKLQVLKLIDDQNPTSEQLQELIGSGFFCDYFEAKRRGKKITREMQREAFGLEPLLVVYKVVVDYDISLAEMIEAGGYDWVNDDITAEHFPLKSEGKWEVEITLLHFNRFISSDVAIEEADPVILLPELLALGARYPELQKQFPVVALGSVWQYRSGYHAVPYLWGAGSKCGLVLGLFENDWDPDFRFAVARKRRRLEV